MWRRACRFWKSASSPVQDPTTVGTVCSPSDELCRLVSSPDVVEDGTEDEEAMDPLWSEGAVCLSSVSPLSWSWWVTNGGAMAGLVAGKSVVDSCGAGRAVSTGRMGDVRCEGGDCAGVGTKDVGLGGRRSGISMLTGLN